jgi:hypothetical protein
VSLALLLTRLYAPLTALASARLEVMSALVSFERVFEVLDLKPLVTEKADAGEVPEGPVWLKFDGVSFGYPSADKVSLASLEEVATPDTRGGVEVLHGVSFRAEPGQMIALVGSWGAGKCIDLVAPGRPGAGGQHGVGGGAVGAVRGVGRSAGARHARVLAHHDHHRFVEPGVDDRAVLCAPRSTAPAQCGAVRQASSEAAPPNECPR